MDEAAFRELLEADVAAGTYDWTMLGFDSGFRSYYLWCLLGIDPGLIEESMLESCWSLLAPRGQVNICLCRTMASSDCWVFMTASTWNPFSTREFIYESKSWIVVVDEKAPAPPSIEGPRFCIRTLNFLKLPCLSSRPMAWVSCVVIGLTSNPKP